MKHLSFILCALALAVPISIGVSACTEEQEDPCEDFCDKFEKCYETSKDCMPSCLHDQEENTPWYQNMIECDLDADCDDWENCIFDF